MLTSAPPRSAPRSTAARSPRRSPAARLRALPASALAATLLGTAMTAVWIWWALNDGGFFGTVLHPGSLLLYTALAVVLLSIPLPIVSRGPHAVALLALLGLSAWTALSLLWTPTRDLALEDAQRAFVYSGALLGGLILTITLGRRMLLSVVPLLAAGAAVAAVVTLTVLTSAEVTILVGPDGTLEFPFGYRNANAGFFVIVALCALAIVPRRGSGTLMRCGCTGLASACFTLAAISQSRGSLLGLLVGAAVLLAVSPFRGRLILAFGSALLPVAIAFPTLIAPAEADGDTQLLASLQDAALAAPLAALAAAALALGSGLLQPKAPRRSRSRRSRRGPTVATAAVVLALAGLAVIAFGNPATWVGDRVDQVVGGDGPIEESRFTYTGGLNRTDFYRVAVDQAEDAPLLGGGSGSFGPRYLLDRESPEAPKDAHSLFLGTLGELGLVGLGLILLTLGATTATILRARKLGPEARILASAALAVGACWAVQAAVDWSWSFAGMTAPVIALIGSAGAPAALALRPVSRRITRSIAAGAALLAVLAIPTFASDRLTLNAATDWRVDPEGAYEALQSAAALNPIADLPLLVEAEIARQSDDPGRALAALRKARERQPGEWQNHRIAAQVLSGSDPAQALLEADLALELIPGSEELRRLRSRLAGEAG